MIKYVCESWRLFHLLYLTCKWMNSNFSWFFLYHFDPFCILVRFSCIVLACRKNFHPNNILPALKQLPWHDRVRIDYVGRFPYPPPNIDYISLYHRTFTTRYGYHCFEFFWVLPTLYWTLCLDPVNRWGFLHKIYWEWVAQYAACSFSGLTTDGSMVDRYACVFVVLFCVLFFLHNSVICLTQVIFYTFKACW